MLAFFSHPRPPGRQVLKQLEREVTGQFDQAVNLLRSSNQQELHALAGATEKLALLRESVRQLLTESSEPEQMSGQLAVLRAGILQALNGHAERGFAGCAILSLTLASLSQALSGLRRDRSSQPASRTIVFPAEVLFQARLSLFPPEKMQVGAGRGRGPITTIGTLFEVTGQAGSGHVRADSSRLGEALIAMELSGCHLAAWLHSHPGVGPACTAPSTIDVNQHQEWISVYSKNLVSVILVADGFLRFFGTALENHEVRLQIAGSGIEETEEEYVFRFQQ